jgi:hypothetical protein
MFVDFLPLMLSNENMPAFVLHVDNMCISTSTSTFSAMIVCILNCYSSSNHERETNERVSTMICHCSFRMSIHNTNSNYSSRRQRCIISK